MSKLSELVATAYETAYDLKQKKQYSEPKIYNAGGDINERWYVYFSYRNPATDKLERQTPIYTGLHHHKNLRDRNAAVKMLRDSLSDVLRNGYNPYDESETAVDEQKKMTVAEAIKFVVDLKENEYQSHSFIAFRSRLFQFRDWMLKNGFENRYITSVNKNVVVNYLNYVLHKNSASNRNNTRAAISTFFSTLKVNDIVQINFIDEINILKTKPERNKSYTTKQETDIFERLEKIDPILALYIKFVSYNFLRPVEVNRLKVRDINLNDKRIYVVAKNKRVKIKILPDILIKDLPDLSQYDNDAFLFGMIALGEHWNTTETSRRGFYTKKFKKLIKNHFKLDKNYGMYSFRHTFIAKLYNALLKGSTPFAAKSSLMLITGHTTMSALEEYLRDIDAELPDDYSHLL